MEADSYYASDGDVAYVRVRSPNGSVRSDEQPWGLQDFDEQSGVLVRLEVWSASHVLPEPSRICGDFSIWNPCSS